MVPLTGQDARAALGRDPGISAIGDDERQALRVYSTNWFWLIQQHLWRTPEADSYGRAEREFVEGAVARIDAALRRLRGPEHELIVYRGGPAPPDDGLMLGYVSASIDIEIARDIAGATGDVWEIRVPAHSQVLLLMAAGATEHPAHSEVLIGRGRRFILHEVNVGDHNGRHLRVELEGSA